MKGSFFVRVTWVQVLQFILALLGVAALAAGLVGLLPSESAAQQAVAVLPTASPSLVFMEGALPRAWQERTPIPPPSATPTVTPSVTVTATRPGQTATLRPTRTPTFTLSPTPTQTPIHWPADGPPTWIRAESIGLDSEVVPVGIVTQVVDGEEQLVWNVADYAAGFHMTMAWPGHVGNTVLSAHNNIRGEVFADIHLLELGASVYLWVGDVPYHYLVTEQHRVPMKGISEEVAAQNLTWIQPTDDQRLTLVTCWPPWSNTHRTIVVCFPAPWPE